MFSLVIMIFENRFVYYVIVSPSIYPALAMLLATRGYLHRKAVIADPSNVLVHAPSLCLSCSFDFFFCTSYFVSVRLFSVSSLYSSLTWLFFKLLSSERLWLICITITEFSLFISLWYSYLASSPVSHNSKSSIILVQFKLSNRLHYEDGEMNQQTDKPVLRFLNICSKHKVT